MEKDILTYDDAAWRTVIVIQKSNPTAGNIFIKPHDVHHAVGIVVRFSKHNENLLEDDGWRAELPIYDAENLLIATVYGHGVRPREALVDAMANMSLHIAGRGGSMMRDLRQHLEAWEAKHLEKK